uniref:Uncharacterized protein n=1 Tax=Arundo donax TaxID=35708 RepID=A0A0A9ADX8_ARUDO
MLVQAVVNLDLSVLSLWKGNKITTYIFVSVHQILISEYQFLVPHEL